MQKANANGAVVNHHQTTGGPQQAPQPLPVFPAGEVNGQLSSSNLMYKAQQQQQQVQEEVEQEMNSVTGLNVSLTDDMAQMLNKE